MTVRTRRPLDRPPRQHPPSTASANCAIEARTPPASGAASPRPPYDRQRDLPRLVPLWPGEIADATAEGRRRVIGLLRRALRGERQRGIGRHWTYDLARHAQLRDALDAEIRLLREAGEPARGSVHPCR